MSKHPTTSTRLGLMLKLAVEEKKQEKPQPGLFGFPGGDAQVEELVVEWIQARDASWFNLDELDFDHEYFREELSGVFLIWSAPGKCLRVGQGAIAARLDSLRRDSEIRSLSLFSPLFATWARVPEALCDGVEKYLEARFKPATGARGLEVDAIKVNDPVL